MLLYRPLTSTNWWIFKLIFCLTGILKCSIAAGQERGVFRKAPTIKQKNAVKKVPVKAVGKTPPIISLQEFEPRATVNATVASGVDTMNNAQLQTDQLIVETRQEIRPKDSESWAKISEHFRVWDERHVNPYGYNIKEFNQLIAIQLIDSTRKQYWSAPLNEGRPTSIFGWRKIRWHKGIDLNLNTGDTIRAVFDGQVRVVNYEARGFGRYVVVRHYNGLETVYGHMSKQLVSPRQEVKAGDVLGLGGSTGRSSGAHLHFEIRFEGHPFNPLEIFAFPENVLRASQYILSPNVFSYITGRTFAEPETEGPAEEEEEIEYRETDWYTVVKGDTLDGISQRSGISINRIKELNALRTTRLQIGQKLRLK